MEADIGHRGAVPFLFFLLLCQTLPASRAALPTPENKEERQQRPALSLSTHLLFDPCMLTASCHPASLRSATPCADRIILAYYTQVCTARPGRSRLAAETRKACQNGASERQ